MGVRVDPASECHATFALIPSLLMESAAVATGVKAHCPAPIDR